MNTYSLSIDDELKPLVNDMLRVTTVLLVVLLLFTLLTSNKISLFTIQSLALLIFTNIGLATYHLLVKNMILIN